MCQADLLFVISRVSSREVGREVGGRWAVCVLYLFRVSWISSQLRFPCLFSIHTPWGVACMGELMSGRKLECTHPLSAQASPSPDAVMEKWKRFLSAPGVLHSHTPTLTTRSSSSLIRRLS
ncbi:hypothetical protein AB1N83_011044 [Pleurotus pulmonarius]